MFYLSVKVFSGLLHPYDIPALPHDWQPTILQRAKSYSGITDGKMWLVTGATAVSTKTDV